MKQKFTIHLLDMPMTVVSDDDEATVKALAAELNDRAQTILYRSRQISKTEAALFCALEYLSDLKGARSAADRAEAQLKLYADNLARLREETDRLQKRVDELEARAKK